MSTSELAVLAKTDKAYLETLWLAVYRLIILWARRYYRVNHLYDTEDLIQAGFLALNDAFQTYNPQRAAFTTHLRFYVRRRFNEVAGRLETCSLDEPLGEVCRLDFLADKEAHFAYDGIIGNLDNRQAYDTIIAEMEKLPLEQRQAITLHICEGRTMQDTAAAMGCTASRARQHEHNGLRKLRSFKEVRLISLDFQHVPLRRFKQTHTSAVEEMILWHERQGVI